MEALLVSISVVALAEIGDKTQLLAMLLAARHRRPLPIIFGILVATLANHALAAAVGAWITEALGAHTMQMVLGIGFLAMAVWTLIPDKAEELKPKAGWGVFGATVVAFFLIEMGDKTQIATVALAAAYSSFGWVLCGSTLGMMLANVPAVLLGERILKRVRMSWIRAVAAAVFVLMGIAALLSV